MFLIAFVLAFLFFTSAMIPQFFHTIFGSPDSVQFSKWEVGKPPIFERSGNDKPEKMRDEGLYIWDNTFNKRIISIVVFFFLQIMFIWGEGYYHEPSGFVKVCKVSLLAIIGSCMAALLLGATVLSFLEFGDRYIGLIRGGQMIDFNEFWKHPIPERWFWQLILGAWIFWLLVIIIYARWENSNSIAPKVIGLVISGSWINSVISLMVDLSVRPRYIGCIFAAGSWFALIVSVPVLVWSIGPGIYLLYLIERRKIVPDSKKSITNEQSNDTDEKARYK
jgi:hypothetical protein